MIFKLKSLYFKTSNRCVPYITQDGYDSGLMLRCDLHTREMNFGEPIMVMEPDGTLRQTYNVTYSMMKQLVKDHYKRFKE